MTRIANSTEVNNVSCKFEEYRGTDRTGLYVLIWIIFINVLVLPNPKDVRDIVREEVRAALEAKEDTDE